CQQHGHWPQRTF
nr:immunoglobulin light chain junction region [Macaca mulatta]